MCRRSLMLILPLAILLSTASFCHAQGNKAALCRKTASFRERLPYTDPIFVAPSPSLVKSIYLQQPADASFIKPVSPEVMETRLNCLLQLQQIKRRLLAQKIENNPPVLGERVRQKSVNLVYKGVVLNTLHEGELVIMGSAYNNQGRLVSYLKEKKPGEKAVLLSKIEEALPGDNIERVLFAIQSPAPTKTGRPIVRIIAYYPNTGKIVDFSKSSK